MQQGQSLCVPSARRLPKGAVPGIVYGQPDSSTSAYEEKWTCSLTVSEVLDNDPEASVRLTEVVPYVQAMMSNVPIHYTRSLDQQGGNVAKNRAFGARELANALCDTVGSYHPQRAHLQPIR